MAREKSYSIFARQLKEHLYRQMSLKLWQSERLDATSKPEEKEADFRNRLVPMLSERLSVERDKLEKSFASKKAKLEDQIRRAQTRLSARRSKFLTWLVTLLWRAYDAYEARKGHNLPGRRGSINPALHGVATEASQQSSAKADLGSLQQKKVQLEQQLQDELKQLETDLSPARLKLEPLQLKPQKGDIEADEVSLVWLPFRISPAGAVKPVYQTTDL